MPSSCGRELDGPKRMTFRFGREPGGVLRGRRRSQRREGSAGAERPDRGIGEDVPADGDGDLRLHGPIVVIREAANNGASPRFGVRFSAKKDEAPEVVGGSGGGRYW